MKNRKKILMSSLVMLIVATVALSTTTYAWFTTGSEGTIDTFNFSAASSDGGIQFSVDAESWKTTITSSDIANAVSKQTNYAQTGSMFVENSTFIPLSTVSDTLSNGALKLFTASTTSDGGIETKTSDSGYYVFNVYVNNMSSSAQTLLLESFSVTDYTTTGENAVADKDASKAVRIAFIDQGAVSKLSSPSAEVIEAVVATTGSTINILEPNSADHTSNAKNYYSAKDEKLAYYGVSSAGSIAAENISQGFITAGAINFVEKAETTDAAIEVASLAADSVTKLTVYVWLEGQDIDCYNDIAGGQVSVQLKFNLKK